MIPSVTTALRDKPPNGASEGLRDCHVLQDSAPSTGAQTPPIVLSRNGASMTCCSILPTIWPIARSWFDKVRWLQATVRQFTRETLTVGGSGSRQPHLALLFLFFPPTTSHAITPYNARVGQLDREGKRLAPICLNARAWREVSIPHRLNLVCGSAVSSNHGGPSSPRKPHMAWPPPRSQLRTHPRALSCLNGVLPTVPGLRLASASD